MWPVLFSIGLLQPIATLREVVPFPKAVLAKLLANQNQAVPGTRVESPLITDSSGGTWQVNLYPFGGNADPNFAGRVGVYLRTLDSGGETDATFALNLHVLPGATSLATDSSTCRGLTFRCGMTFCAQTEAGESVGRCEDWGAHVYSSDLLLAELEAVEGSICAIEVRPSK